MKLDKDRHSRSPGWKKLGIRRGGGRRSRGKLGRRGIQEVHQVLYVSECFGAACSPLGWSCVVVRGVAGGAGLGGGESSPVSATSSASRGRGRRATRTRGRRLASRRGDRKERAPFFMAIKAPAARGTKRIGNTAARATAIKSAFYEWHFKRDGRRKEN
jgi:hypothetical protein